MLHTRISTPESRFLCGKKFPSLLKETNFLPQSGKNFFVQSDFLYGKTNFHGLQAAISIQTGRECGAKRADTVPVYPMLFRHMLLRLARDVPPVPPG